MAAQAEVQPGPLYQPLLPCLSARHVAPGAACLNVRLAHQGIPGVPVLPCVGDPGVESTAAAPVAGGTSDPVRKVFPQAGSVGPERNGNALVRKIAPLDAPVAGGTAVDFRRARVVLADARRIASFGAGRIPGEKPLLQDAPGRLPGADHDEHEHAQERAGCHEKREPQEAMLAFQFSIGQGSTPPRARRRPTSARGTMQRA